MQKAYSIKLITPINEMARCRSSKLTARQMPKLRVKEASNLVERGVQAIQGAWSKLAGDEVASTPSRTTVLTSRGNVAISLPIATGQKTTLNSGQIEGDYHSRPQHTTTEECAALHCRAPSSIELRDYGMSLAGHLGDAATSESWTFA